MTRLPACTLFIIAASCSNGPAAWALIVAAVWVACLAARPEVA